MKLTQEERRSFAASFLPKVPPATIAQYYRQMNHEIWRKCNRCGEVFDLRKSLKTECPTCGYEELKTI